MSTKDMISALTKHETTFTVAGIFNHKNELYVFKTHARIGFNDEVSVAFYQDTPFGSGMNVEKFGKKRISLYTYTPFQKRVNETLYLKDITILTTGSEPLKP